MEIKFIVSLLLDDHAPQKYEPINFKYLYVNYTVLYYNDYMTSNIYHAIGLSM